MEPSDSPLLEPSEYAKKIERVRHVEDPLEQHNTVVALLLGARRDRHTAGGDPHYDPVIRQLERLEHESSGRLAGTRAPNEG